MSGLGKSGVAVITGVGRRRSIGAGLAVGMARDGWNLALNYWRPYDDRVGLERSAEDPESVADECRALGVTVELIPGDLTRPETPAELLRAARSIG
ncbi:MAG: SDR family oxidoreductase, partial [Leifsonia sp.]